MKVLNAALLRKFLKTSSDELTGEWILLGGTVLPALGIDHRTTVDIDFTNLGEVSNSVRLKLMKIAEKLGLPVETINPAAEFYLSKIKGYRSQLIELHRGKNAVIYRPSATLYLELKIQRLSESDLSDCLEMLKYAKKKKEPLDTRRLTQLIQSKLSSDNSENIGKRLKTLLDAL